MKQWVWKVSLTKCMAVVFLLFPERVWSLLPKSIPIEGPFCLNHLMRPKLISTAKKEKKKKKGQKALSSPILQPSFHGLRSEQLFSSLSKITALWKSNESKRGQRHSIPEEWTLMPKDSPPATQATTRSVAIWNWRNRMLLDWTKCTLSRILHH